LKEGRDRDGRRRQTALGHREGTGAGSVKRETGGRQDDGGAGATASARARSEGDDEEEEDEDEEGTEASKLASHSKLTVEVYRRGCVETYRSNSYARSRARVPWLKPVT
jgi:hypothetical protein